MSDCSSCPSHGNCSSGSCSSSSAAPEFINMAKGNKALTVIAVGSGKGGVGKSSVSALLAVMLSRKGYKTGIFDADLTGPSMAEAFGVSNDIHATEDHLLKPPHTYLDMPLMSLNLLLEHKEDPVVWRGPMIGSVLKQFWTEVAWGKLDCLIIDMPPGTGDVAMTVFKSLPVDRYVVVTTPQSMVRMIVAKACKMAEMLNVPILGVVENMAGMKCPGCSEILYPFGKGNAEEICEKMNLKLLDRIMINPKINEMMDEGTIEYVDDDYLENTVIEVSNLIERKKKILRAGGEDVE